MLGPILFLVNVNDLPDSILRNLYMFADDTKLYCAIKSKEDCDILQQYLDNAIDWGTMWLTNFNSSKCKVFSLGTQVSIVNAYSMSYPDGLHQLIRSRVEEEEEDLGVLLSSTLKFSHYVREKVHKANRLLGLIFWNHKCCAIFTLH